jgi:hypothetical protein
VRNLASRTQSSTLEINELGRLFPCNFWKPRLSDIGGHGY